MITDKDIVKQQYFIAQVKIGENTHPEAGRGKDNRQLVSLPAKIDRSVRANMAAGRLQIPVIAYDEADGTIYRSVVSRLNVSVADFAARQFARPSFEALNAVDPFRLPKAPTEERAR